jgi:oligopeptide transport system ATP-binding protein
MPLLDVQGLVKEYPRRRGWLSRPTAVRAVDGVSFSIERGETFGLVGESGSGKTTVGRCVLRLVEPTSGTVRFDGRDVLGLSPGELRLVRRNMQAVFQDPETSLNPRMRVGAIVEEPLVVHRLGTTAERRARVETLFELVGLDPALARRYPAEFSGGQRQRIAIARALALSPSFIVADEPVSALDVSVQAQVVNLLADLQARLGLTYLLIAHDLRLVEHVCSRLAVMYGGRILEMGPTERVFHAAAHPYTRALLSAVPSLDPDAPPQPLEWDATAIDLRQPLAELSNGHWAAV